jgi:DNA-binding transcriptional LysR family regulator
VGIAFFQKSGRRMELTIAGREFLQRVEPLVQQIEQAVLAHASPDSLQGVVRIGVSHVMLNWFPGVIAQLKLDMPGVRYEIDMDAGASMVQKLEAGRMDIAVVAGKARNPRMASVSLRPEELQWLMSSRIPRKVDSRKLTTAELLAEVPIWVVPHSSIIFADAMAALRRHNAPQNNLNTCVTMTGILSMVDQTGGIGLTASSVAKPHLAAGLVQPVGPDLPALSLDVTLMYHRDQHQTIVRKVIERLVEFDRCRLD